MARIENLVLAVDRQGQRPGALHRVMHRVKLPGVVRLHRQPPRKLHRQVAHLRGQHLPRRDLPPPPARRACGSACQTPCPACRRPRRPCAAAAGRRSVVRIKEDAQVANLRLKNLDLPAHSGARKVNHLRRCAASRLGPAVVRSSRRHTCGRLGLVAGRGRPGEATWQSPGSAEAGPGSAGRDHAVCLSVQGWLCRESRAARFRAGPGCGETVTIRRSRGSR